MARAMAALRLVLWSAAALSAAAGGPLFSAPVPPSQADLPASGPAQAARPSTPQYFKSWAVGCDNILRCEAISLLPEDGAQENEAGSATLPIELQLVREGAPSGRLELHARSIEALPDRLRLVADGREIARLERRPWAEPGLDGSKASDAVRAMANAITIEILDRKKRRLAVIPTEGLIESLRFMDTQQGRAGTVTALIMRGDQPASAVPAAPPVPRGGATLRHGSRT